VTELTPDWPEVRALDEEGIAGAALTGRRTSPLRVD
jgi:hypothetical protein